MSETIEVWGVAVAHPNQRDEVKAHCFGDCGKISMAGAIDDPLTGGLMVCCERACPYLDKELRNYGETMSFGKKHTVHLRTIRKISKHEGGKT